MQTQNQSLVLVAGTALLIAPQITAAQRQAAIDCLLYAQLIANKRAGNRFAQPSIWYRAYRAVYGEIKWLVTGQAHDTQNVTAITELVISEPLQAWLGQAGIDGVQVLRRAIGGLRHHCAGQRQLEGFICPVDRLQQPVVLEIGLLDAQAHLHLCSLTWQCTASVEGAMQPSLDEMAALPAEVQLRCISLVCDVQAFEPMRSKLHTLITSKQQQTPYVLDLGITA